MQVPFTSSSECKASRLIAFYFKIRVTVLEGPLTVTGVYAEGPYSPYINHLEGNVYQTGEAFEVKCGFGESDAVTKRGDWDQALFGVHTREAGQIIKLSTVITYT